LFSSFEMKTHKKRKERKDNGEIVQITMARLGADMRAERETGREGEGKGWVKYDILEQVE